MWCSRVLVLVRVVLVCVVRVWVLVVVSLVWRVRYSDIVSFLSMLRVVTVVVAIVL